MAQNNTVNAPQKAGQGASEIKINGITIETIQPDATAEAALVSAVAAKQAELYKNQNNASLGIGSINSACNEADYGVLGKCYDGDDQGLCSCSKVSGQWQWRWVIS